MYRANGDKYNAIFLGRSMKASTYKYSLILRPCYALKSLTVYEHILLAKVNKSVIAKTSSKIRQYKIKSTFGFGPCHAEKFSHNYVEILQKFKVYDNLTQPGRKNLQQRNSESTIIQLENQAR